MLFCKALMQLQMAHANFRSITIVNKLSGNSTSYKVLSGIKTLPLVLLISKTTATRYKLAQFLSQSCVANA